MSLPERIESVILTPLERWQLGISLRQAIRTFAEPEALAQYDEAAGKAANDADRTTFALVGLIRFLIRDARERDAVFDEAHRKYDASLKAGTRSKELLAGFKSSIANALVCGDLIALGYRMPRSIEDVPREVPPDLWRGQIDWDSSAVSGSGFAFNQVHVVHPQWIEQAKAKILVKSIGPAPPPKALGRPSLKRDIEQAYRDLVSAGLIQASETMTSVHQKVRAALSRVHPDRAGSFKGMAKETVRRALRDLHPGPRGRRVEKAEAPKSEGP